MKKIFLPVICGPTASGKTKLSIDIAKDINAEIVSADSMQIYKGMDIASAKPDTQEMQGIIHHMMSFLPLDKAFSVSDYVKAARTAIDDIVRRGKVPLVVGGTGLYISSLIDNIVFDDTGSDMEFREKMRKKAAEKGNEALLAELAEVDIEAAQRLHPNNLSRIIRALEVYHLSGKKISELQKESRAEPAPYTSCVIMLNYTDRTVLYERINRRVDVMVEKGLVEEARDFFTRDDYITASQAIGYKELKPYLDGEAELEECIDKLKQVTRNYAKRQITWFKKIRDIHMLDINTSDSYQDIFEKSKKIIENSSISE